MDAFVAEFDKNFRGRGKTGATVLNRVPVGPGRSTREAVTKRDRILLAADEANASRSRDPCQ